MAVLLPQSLKYGDDRHEPPHPANGWWWWGVIRMSCLVTGNSCSQEALQGADPSTLKRFHYEVSLCCPLYFPDKGK